MCCRLMADCGSFQDLAFQPRALPIQEVDRQGLAAYLIFLLIFISVTFRNRDADLYYVVAMARDIFRHEDFSRMVRASPAWRVQL